MVLALAGCQPDQAEREQAADSAAAAGVVAPPRDTLLRALDLHCSDGTVLHANELLGTQRRMVIATQDTGVILPWIPADSVERYAAPDGRAAFSTVGDSVRFTFRGTTTMCGLELSR
jgi:hypothetical protein